MAELNLNELKQKTRDAKSVLVLLPPEPEAELVSAAMALHQALKAAGKTSVLGCSTAIPGNEEVKTAVGKQNLIISFPYREDAVEHVSYDIDETNNRFNLIIKPKETGQPLDAKNVIYSYTGAKGDLVFAFGITSLEELGRLYSDEKQFLDNAPIVAIKKGGQPADFATYDLSGIRVLSLAELIVWFAKQTELKLAGETASGLYKQLLTSTNNFQSPLITPETFEAAAYLLRAGARTFPTAPAMPSTLPSAPANLPPAPHFPAPEARPKATIPNNNGAPQTPRTNVPPDWQGPKIFRAGELG